MSIIPEKDHSEYEVICNDEWVASASGPDSRAFNEAMNYAAQYVGEGEVEVYKVTRQLIVRYEDKK